MEANFVVDSVAENLKCVVCHFVLKDPVLIIDCGHRLCKACFESVRGYAVQHSNPLLCPHDRKNINVDKVVDDIGVARMVMDLQVFCDNKPEGCFWSGELRQLENHVNKQCNVTSLRKFMAMVETRLNQKDIEMQELHANLSSRDQEMLELRTSLSSKDGEVERIRCESGKKFEEVEERLRVVEENLGEKEEELALLRYEMAGLRVNLARKSKGADSSAEPKRQKTRSEIIYDEKENQHMCVDIGANSDGGESVKKIEQGYREMDIALLDFRLASVRKELSLRQAQLKGVDEAKGKTSKEVEDTNNPFNQGGSSSSIDSVVDADCGANCGHCTEIRSLEERVMNVDTYIPNVGVVFLWKIRNYSRYKGLGNRIDSPQFYSDISGHCNNSLQWGPDRSLDLQSNSNNIDKMCNTNQKYDDVKEEITDAKLPENLIDVSKRLVVAWRGAFALKNSAFPVRMHLIDGNPELANFFLRGMGPGAGPAVKVLSVTQRLRLDPSKLDEVSRCINQVGATGHCVLLALPTGEVIDLDSTFQRRPLKSLVTYFKKKEAAGVIILNTDGPSGKQEESGMLHAFPPCTFSQQLLKVALNLPSEPLYEDHLVIIIVKGTAA